MKYKPKKTTVYLDGVDWVHEVGNASDGNKIYPSVESLKEYNKCWEDCGIVECTILYKKWIHKQDLFKKVRTISSEEMETDVDTLYLQGAKRHLKHLEESVDRQKHRIINLEANIKGRVKK